MFKNNSKDPYAGCTFRDLNNCGSGKYGEENLVTVSQLQKNTESHFKDLKVGYSNISVKYLKERHLIENRSGKLLSKMDEICPKHRESFGVCWKPSTVCQHPEHLVENQKHQGQYLEICYLTLKDMISTYQLGQNYVHRIIKKLQVLLLKLASCTLNSMFLVTVSVLKHVNFNICKNILCLY